MLPTHEDAARIVAIRRRREAEHAARDRGFARDAGDRSPAAPSPVRPLTPPDAGCQPCPPPSPSVRQASTMAR